ncbi:MAG: prenyltransferase/squalene oxidase repeat-containing protein [Roseiflexaceae bacterium]
MGSSVEVLLTDLRYLIGDLGKDGGLIGPSIYDTAQVIRFAPPAQGVEPALDWLLAQQQPDGGWGDPSVPLARDIPTLAALLALHMYTTSKAAHDAILSGLLFLQRQSAQWQMPLPDDIPLAAEFVLPALVKQAQQQGFALDAAPYARLRTLGDKRRQMIAQLQLHPGTAPMHSWEAWGQRPDVRLLDGADSIGHSPAATAAWLYATRGRTELDDARARTQCYLDRAMLSTGVDIPGVQPTVWPYERNEQSVSMFAVMLAGLLDHPALHEVVRAQLDDMWRGLRPEGQGISDHFTTDGDITAMDFAILATAGYRPDPAVLRRYIVGDSCLTYPNEMQRSLSATTHAAHALAILDDDPTPLLKYLYTRRTDDGRLLGDKWHASWLYLTGHALHALIEAGQIPEALSILQALIDHQHDDGSWSVTAAVGEETAYAVLGLLAFQRRGSLPDHGWQALRRAERWLLHNYRPLTEEYGACWAAKEMYRPRRIARTIEVSATLACVLAQDEL